jgi:hypothetical protein
MISQSLHITEKWRESRSLFFCVFCLFAFLNSVTAQIQEWVYIARSEEGRFYVKRKIDQLSGGNRAMWMKIVSDDGSEQISYSEWDCKGRRFRLLQTSSYAADGTAIEHLKNLDWAFVTPESAAESLFGEACGNPMTVKYAVIILKEVKLRDAPNINGQVYRTAKRNEKFPLTPFDPVGAWYHIYDPKTLVEYWVHGNGIKIVSGNSDNIKSNKLKKNIVRKKTKRTVNSGKQR